MEELKDVCILKPEVVIQHSSSLTYYNEIQNYQSLMSKSRSKYITDVAFDANQTDYYVGLKNHGGIA